MIKSQRDIPYYRHLKRRKPTSFANVAEEPETYLALPTFSSDSPFAQHEATWNRLSRKRKYSCRWLFHAQVSHSLRILILAATHLAPSFSFFECGLACPSATKPANAWPRKYSKIPRVHFLPQPTTPMHIVHAAPTTRQLSRLQVQEGFSRRSRVCGMLNQL